MKFRLAKWLAFLFLVGCSQHVVGPLNVQSNSHAIKMLQDEKTSDAQKIWLEEMEELPLQPELHLNLGVAAEKQKNNSQAVNYYTQAVKLSRSPEERFYATYNLAQILAKEKQIDLALLFYQMALEIKPDHYETKVNIELLMQQQQQQEQDKKDQGEGGSKDPNQPQEPNKDQSQEPKDGKDPSQEGEGEDKDKKEEDDKKYGKPPKNQPRPFEGKELDQNDVNKILSELKQQEQKIRANFNRKKVKEEPREKDW